MNGLFSAPETPGPGGRERIYHIVAGRTSLRPARFQEKWPNLIGRCVAKGASGRDFVRLGPAEELRKSVSSMLRRDRPLAGGTLYFPSTRRLLAEDGGAIEPPPEVRRWIDRIEDQHGWSGGLDQLWVWLSYLDLEQGRQSESHVRPYVERIERLLGRGRRVFVRQGRVYVSHRDPQMQPVRVSDLPSGEKQLLVLLGELARRGRMGVVCLLDEPEMSLHPALQHALVHHLRSYAGESAAQFILASHSLEVVQAVPGAAIFLDRLEPDLASEAPAALQEAAA